jgi:hypothetical protein
VALQEYPELATQPTVPISSIGQLDEGNSGPRHLLFSNRMVRDVDWRGNWPIDYPMASI